MFWDILVALLVVLNFLAICRVQQDLRAMYELLYNFLEVIEEVKPYELGSSDGTV